MATRLWRCHWICTYVVEDHEDDAKQWEIEEEQERVRALLYRSVFVRRRPFEEIKRQLGLVFFVFLLLPRRPLLLRFFCYLLTYVILYPTAKHLPVISIFVAGIRVQTRNITRERIKSVSIEGMTRDIVNTGVYVVPYRLYPDSAYLRLVSLFNSIDTEIIIFLSEGRDCNRIWWNDRTKRNEIYEFSKTIIFNSFNVNYINSFNSNLKLLFLYLLYKLIYTKMI